MDGLDVTFHVSHIATFEVTLIVIAAVPIKSIFLHLCSFVIVSVSTNVSVIANVIFIANAAYIIFGCN